MHLSFRKVSNIHPLSRGNVAPALSTDNSTLTPNTPMSHKVKPSGSNVPKVQPIEHNKIKHNSSAKASDQPRKVSKYKCEQEN